MQKILVITHIIENSFLETDYYEGHSLLTMQIAFKLTTKLGFAQPEIIAKIIQASILHDALFENKELSSISTITQLKSSKISESDKKIVLDHAEQFASYFKTFNWISDDVITAIREHHCRRDSESLNQVGCPNEITTFSAIFNMSLQAADHFFQFGHNQASINDLKVFFGKIVF